MTKNSRPKQSDCFFATSDYSFRDEPGQRSLERCLINPLVIEISTHAAASTCGSSIFGFGLINHNAFGGQHHSGD